MPCQWLQFGSEVWQQPRLEHLRGQGLMGLQWTGCNGWGDRVAIAIGEVQGVGAHTKASIIADVGAAVTLESQGLPD